MGQFIFFAIFIIALLAGAFAYFTPMQKPINPVKFMMENSGYSDEELHNRKRTQELNVTMSNGLIQIKRKMINLALEQTRLKDMIQNQQQVLKSTGKDAEDILLMTQQEAGKGNNDILQLKALAAEMQDEQRILVARGQELLVLNDQLTKSRQWIADQVNAANINNESSLQSLQQRYMMLNNQASGLFDKVSQHNQTVRDQMIKLQGQMKPLSNNTADDSALQQQNLKQRVGDMLDKVHENISKLADSEEKSRDQMSDLQQNLADSKEALNNSLRQSQDLIENESQNAQEQKINNQQRVADQLQILKDQQNR